MGQADSLAGVRCQVSGARCQVSGVRGQVLGVRCQVLGVRGQVLGVRGQGVRCQGSGVRGQIPGFRFHVSGCWLLVPRFLPSAFGLPAFARNTAGRRHGSRVSPFPRFRRFRLPLSAFPLPLPVFLVGTLAGGEVSVEFGHVPKHGHAGQGFHDLKDLLDLRLHVHK